MTPSTGAQDLNVRTNYAALVLYYNPHVKVGDQYLTVREAYHCRDIDALCLDYVTFLKRASGGQINFSVVARFELDEFPPDNDPSVTFTPENYDQYRSQGYDIFNSNKADYLAICNDPRFQIVPRVETGEVDAVWIFAPDGTGFWETAMAGRDAYWINGAAYPELNCSKRFVLYGFGMASHQGVGFMLENTAHMAENILGNRITAEWPAVHRLTNSTTLDLTNPTRRPQARLLNDWEYFTVSDAVHWDARLVAPGQSQAGISHFPPTACVNYGWSSVRLEFNGNWEVEHFLIYEGTWRLEDRSWTVTGTGESRAILYGSHTLSDSTGEYRVPVIITDADIEAGVNVRSDTAEAHAGVLLRCARYAGGIRPITGYYVGLRPDTDRLELVELGTSPTVLSWHSMEIEPDVTYPLHIRLRGATVEVSLSPTAPPLITYDQATNSIEGAVGFTSLGGGAAFSHLRVIPVIRNHAEAWRSYPELGNSIRALSPLEWRGDGQPYEDNDYWFAWWYEHLPKNPGTHEVRDPGSGQLLGRALNSWWPYIFDINRFDTPFLPDVQIASTSPDVEPPDPPGTLMGIGENATTIRIEWTEPLDNVGVTRYEVYRDNQLLRVTPLRHFTDLHLAPDTAYSYFVKARDGTGNVSNASQRIEVNTPAEDAAFLNGDFEVGLATPIGWRHDAFDSSAVFTWTQPGAGRNGSRCIAIHSGADPNDARWIQEVDGLVPNGRYRLKGWIKGENIVLDQGATIGANLCTFGQSDHSYPALTGTFDWTLIELFVRANTAGELIVGCRLGFWSSLAAGTVWFDDLTLEYAPPIEPSPVKVWGLDLSGVACVPDNLNDLIEISAGDSHALALRQNGSIIAWGANWSGQSAPRPDLTNVIAIAAGSSFNVASTADGQVVAWGDNVQGQCNVPPYLSDTLAVAAGSRFGIALRANGTVVAWGGNDWGETDVPPDLDRVVAIAAGHEFALALRDDGTVVAWGSFQTHDDWVYPARVPEGLNQVVAIDCGLYHALALRADGTVVAWGENESGQTSVPAALNDVVSISAGSNHSLALKADGTIVAWGGNNHGQLDVPASLRTAVLIEGGSHYSLALAGDAPPVFTVRPSSLNLRGDTFELSFPSRRGRAYFLQCRGSLENHAWGLIRGLLATGTSSLALDLEATAPFCFYCLRTRPLTREVRGLDD
jgi:hypothetical protein